MQQNNQPMGNMPSSDTMMGMHDTFWRDDQVMVVFHSDMPLIAGNGVHNHAQILQDVDLSSQLQQINDFLKQQPGLIDNNTSFRLNFLNEMNSPRPGMQTGVSMTGMTYGNTSTMPRGVHIVGMQNPMQKDFGTIQSSVIGFFQLVKEPVQGDFKNQNNRAHVPTIVNTLNQNALDLHKNGSRIEFVAPTWLCGGTPIGQGCPLSPPAPVSNAHMAYHMELPDLKDALQTSTGKDVKVFILDAFPERAVIANAARNAGNSNKLLQNVNETARFNYDHMSSAQGYLLMQHTNCAAVGKDVYGEHYPMLIADHGLFIAGIVRDIAPDADIECIRVLNDLCLGDMPTLIGALTSIYKRVLSVNPDTNQQGDLFGKPVVINLSLVIPTNDQAQNDGFMLATMKDGSPDSGYENILPEPLRKVLQALTDAGVIIVASAGNEGDGREMPLGSPRPDALYPASLSNSNENVIAVGAVTKTGMASTYSCYPGSQGIGAWGGELPGVGEIVPPNPGDPGSEHPQVTFSDAPIGIYSSLLYPPLSAVPAYPPEQYYTPPNQSCWAYWIGTSFATPIVSAAAARILQWKKDTNNTDSVYAILQSFAQVTHWDRLDSNNSIADGPMLRVEQTSS